MMKQFVIILALLIAVPSYAQLPKDPWAEKTAQQQKSLGLVKLKSRQINNYQGDQNPNNVPLPDYVGEDTTWDIDRGQDKIAPDVNITNMLLLTQHMRNVGYQIPEGLDKVISDAPKNLRIQIFNALNDIQTSSHPIAKGTDFMADVFEKYTGFSLTNLIGNSIRIMDMRR